MPKKYLTSNNLKPSLKLMATNMLDNFNIKEWEVSSQLGRLMKGIIDDKTVAKNLPKQYRRRHGYMKTCPKCGKERIKDLDRHNQTSHKALKTID